MTSAHRQWGRILLASAIVAGFAGCAEPDKKIERAPTPAEVSQMIEPNVMGISSQYDPFNPWIWDIDRTRVRGVQVKSLYLLGPKFTGVFGDGIIRPRLSVVQRGADGKRYYKLVKEWAFDVEQAMLFRVKKRFVMGWGYKLFLTWGDLDLSGREIRMVITFERADGLLISSDNKNFRVPSSQDGN